MLFIIYFHVILSGDIFNKICMTGVVGIFQIFSKYISGKKVIFSVYTRFLLYDCMATCKTTKCTRFCMLLSYMHFMHVDLGV